MFEALKGVIPQPEDMKPDAYARTLKARAFDAARYLLPLATNTSLGQIVNARTLETQVSRLLSSPFMEIRELGVKLRTAATEPAWNVLRDKLEELAGEGVVNAEATAQILNELMPPVRTAPTLLKHAEPNTYQRQSRKELAEAAQELMKGAEIYPAPIVDLLDDDEHLEVEPATIPIASCAGPWAPWVKFAVMNYSGSAPRIAASTTSCSERSIPATASGSTSLWTSAGSATCTGIVAAFSSSRNSPTCTVTMSRFVRVSQRSLKPACKPRTRQRWRLRLRRIRPCAIAERTRLHRAPSICCR
jgi:hypothetical protein